MREILRNSGGQAIPLELSIIKNKIDTAERLWHGWKICLRRATRALKYCYIYFIIYSRNIWIFRCESNISWGNKKIPAYKALANMKYFASAYCVKQRNHHHKRKYR